MFISLSQSLLLCMILFFVIIKSENILSDFALTAEPNLTKIVFFYKRISDNITVPLDQTDLNKVTTYLTINQVKNNGTGTDKNYYQYPDFRKLNYSKHENKSWIGSWNMNTNMIKQWHSYSHNTFKTPTFVWKLITNKCFQNSSQIQLYDYSALLPSIIPITYLYVFTWKYRDAKEFKCTQSTYSLVDDIIVCSMFQELSCIPPFN